MEGSHTISIPATQMEAEFTRILLKHRFREDKARLCASIFTGNSVDGILSHGVKLETSLPFKKQLPISLPIIKILFLLTNKQPSGTLVSVFFKSGLQTFGTGFL